MFQFSSFASNIFDRVKKHFRFCCFVCLRRRRHVCRWKGTFYMVSCTFLRQRSQLLWCLVVSFFETTEKKDQEEQAQSILKKETSRISFANFHHILPVVWEQRVLLGGMNRKFRTGDNFQCSRISFKPCSSSRYKIEN